ncbi:MAG TPA: hypothetical protein VFU47_06035, partial [Armatimonadota bacterium]|nr:hypothetical protein [Armatimonadota bacterium]
MNQRGRWLLLGLSGAALFLPVAVHAQARPAPRPAAPAPGPAAPAPRTGVGPQGSFNPPPPIRPGMPVSVLVFPFGYAGEEAAPPAAAAPQPAPGTPAGAEASQLTPAQQETAAYLTAAVKAGFLSTPAYSVVTYHPLSSLVQRALKDEILRPADTAGLVSGATGSVDPAKARQVAYRLGLQTILVGSLDLKEDPKTNTAEVTAEAQLIDSTTGTVLRSAAVSGAATGAEGVPPVAVRERAAQEAAQKILPAMGIELVTPAPPAPPAEQPARGSRRRPSRSSEPKKAQPRRSSDDSQRDQHRAEEKARRDAEAKARAEADEARRAAEEARKEQERAAEKARREAARQEE